MATWRRATPGDRVVRRLVCVLFLVLSVPTSLELVCVPSRLLVHGCNKKRVRAAALINKRISVEPCGTVAGPQASGIERSRRSVHEYMAAEHWPAKQVVRG